PISEYNAHPAQGFGAIWLDIAPLTQRRTNEAINQRLGEKLMYRWVIMPYQEQAISGSSAILKGPRLRGGNKLMKYEKRWLSQALLPQVTVPGNGRKKIVSTQILGYCCQAFEVVLVPLMHCVISRPANSTSDCWRSKCNAQALSLLLLHESRTLFLSLIIRKPRPKRAKLGM